MNVKKRIFPVLLVLALVSGVLAASQWVQDHPRLTGALVLSEVSHLLAGDRVSHAPDYLQESITQTIGGTTTNSVYLTEKMRLIVPILVYEGIGYEGGNYPIVLYFGPGVGERSLHIAGYARLWAGELYVNERYVIDSRWNDEREVLAVLTHELVHFQAGVFVTGDPEDFEARTQAASVEALGALCAYGEKVACSSFWLQLEDFARASLRLELRKTFKDGEKIYQKMADLLWRDAAEERSARKSSRHWNGDPSQLDYILTAYSLNPYRIVMDGVLDNKPLDTGVGSVSFDDSQDMIPNWLEAVLRWAMK